MTALRRLACVTAPSTSLGIGTARATTDGFATAIPAGSAYTVPAGKVLVFQAYTYSGSAPGTVFLTVAGPRSSRTSDWYASGNTTLAPAAVAVPLKLPAGTVLRTSSSATVGIFGVLIDASSLPAP